MSYTIPAEMYTYLEKVIEEAHGANVPPDLRALITQDLYGRLQNHLLTSLIQALPDSESDPFSNFMMTEPDEELVQKFFAEHIPNHQEVVAESLLEFRDVYVGSIKSEI